MQHARSQAPTICWVVHLSTSGRVWQGAACTQAVSERRGMQGMAAQAARAGWFMAHAGHAAASKRSQVLGCHCRLAKLGSGTNSACCCVLLPSCSPLVLLQMSQLSSARCCPGKVLHAVQKGCLACLIIKLGLWVCMLSRLVSSNICQPLQEGGLSAQPQNAGSRPHAELAAGGNTCTCLVSCTGKCVVCLLAVGGCPEPAFDSSGGCPQAEAAALTTTGHEL
jgi:hypothetical protein